MITYDSNEVKEFKQILRSVFGLTKKELACFVKIREIGGEGTCVQNLVMEADSERSVEQKRLTKLLKKGLIERESVSLSDFQHRCALKNRDDLLPASKKGYLYIYHAISDAQLLQKINEKITSWTKTVETYLG